MAAQHARPPETVCSAVSVCVEEPEQGVPPAPVPLPVILTMTSPSARAA